MISRLRLLCSLPLVGLAAIRAELNFDRSIPPVSFASAEIARAAALALADGPLRVSREIAPVANRAPQADRMARPTPDRWRVGGPGLQGATCGGLDIAEAFRTGPLGSLKNSDHSPLIAQRGSKFNLPPDLRTPSSTATADAAQANIPEMCRRKIAARIGWNDGSNLRANPECKTALIPT